MLTQSSSMIDYETSDSYDAVIIIVALLRAYYATE